LEEVEASSLDAEKDLEDWLVDDISILSERLLVIGRQVETDFGGELDLLCLDPAGDLVIVELKRDRTPRQVVAQALDYASWVVDLGGDDIEDQAQEFSELRGDSLEEAFRDVFGRALPDVINESHKILIVGSEIDAHSERIIEYLSDEHGVNINAATFQYFDDEKAGRLLSRVFLIEPGKVETRTRRKGSSKRKPDLTRSELRDRAEEHGVREWYRAIEKKLSTQFKTPETTQSSLSFKADLSDTPFEVQTGTIFSLWPDPALWPDERDSSRSGLYFQVYTYRLAARLEIEEETIRSLLPENQEEWSYGTEWNERWSGVDGFFETEDEVEAFIEGIVECAEM
jgi:hypothetical protein